MNGNHSRIEVAACLRLGQHINQTELGREIALPQPTVHRSLYPLETSFMEVDLVVETGGRLLPIEIKSSKRPRLADATNLRTFRSEYGKRARAGLLLHAGESVEWIAPDVLAAPWWRVI